MRPDQVCRPEVRSTKERLRLWLLERAAGRPFAAGGRRDLDAAPRSVLLVRPDHLGDMLFTGPALRHLRQAWPDAHLAMLVGPWAGPVAEAIPEVDEVLPCPFPWFSRRPRKWPWEPYALLRREARRLRQRQFDLAVILRFDHWWGAWLVQRAGIPDRVGYDVPGVMPFLTRAVPYAPGHHEVLQNLALVEAVTGSALDPGQRSLSFRPAGADIRAASDLLDAEGIRDGDVIVCVHPGTGAPVKLWRNECWVQVIEGLVRACGVKVAVTGGPGELDLVRDLVARLTVPVVNLSGRTNIGQLAAVMARCRLVLGVDSGPLHLAVAVGTPTVHLFGPVDPRLFGPWGDPGKHLVLTSGRDCIPCNRLDYAAGELDAHPCVREIRVESVLAAARRLLGSSC